jgi:hypothetical protein
VHTRRFLAIDGEGGDVGGRHEYTLLVAAGKDFQSCVHNDGAPLTATQCLDFILSLPPRRKLISFWFDYDVSMILRELDHETLGRLLDRDSRTTYSGRAIPCEWNDYKLDWIGGKLFKVSRGKASRIIYDTAGFFQSSLVKALEGWDVGDDKEREFIQRMKGERSRFTGEVNDEVIQYATTECKLLCKLMDLVYRESYALGFRLRTFSGAGSLANAMLGRWRVQDRIGQLPSDVMNASWHAYFGGRFEVAAVGEIPGPIYEYDINSAYPYAMQDLPCLSCGEWEKRDATDPDADLNLCYVIWKIVDDNLVREFLNPHWGPLPWRHRSHGTISFPFSGKGWYWEPEVRAALEGPFGRYIDVREVWAYRTGCEHKPFGAIPELYERRKVLKAAGHLGERVLKLGLNSLYGKTAQTVGRPRFASRVWAGMITATARAMCYRAIASPEGHGGDVPNVIMVATDALYSRVPLPCLELGDGLGQWEEKVHKNMLIVQPGLYALNVDTDQATLAKTRGIRRASFGPSDALALWREHRLQATFEVPVRSFVGLRRGYISSEYEPGQWIDETKVITFWPRSKRMPIPMKREGVTYLPSIPPDDEPEESASYVSRTLTPELRDATLMAADDAATPTVEERSGRIPGFESHLID